MVCDLLDPWIRSVVKHPEACQARQPRLPVPKLQPQIDRKQEERGEIAGVVALDKKVCVDLENVS